MNNKKAQIATTLTWIPAFIIVFFILMVVLAVSIFSIPKLISLKNGAGAESSFDPVLEKELSALLNTPISELENKKLLDVLIELRSSKDYAHSVRLRSIVYSFFEEYFEEFENRQIVMNELGVDSIPLMLPREGVVLETSFVGIQIGEKTRLNINYRFLEEK
jgi:hypothetical protein